MTTSTETQTQTLIPYLCARGAGEAIALYESVFGAEVIGDVWRDPDDGRVGHAELRIGDMAFYLSDEYEWLGVLSPTSRGGTTVSLVLLVDDLDPVWEIALERGATVEHDITVDYGRRAGWLTDPWGHRWNVGELSG